MGVKSVGSAVGRPGFRSWFQPCDLEQALQPWFSLMNSEGNYKLFLGAAVRTVRWFIRSLAPDAGQ